MKTLPFSLFFACIVLFISACKLDKPIFPKLKSTTSTGTTGTGTGSGSGTGSGTGTGTTTSGEYYFKGTIDGQSINWQVTDNFTGWVTGSSGDGSVDKGVYTGSLEALLSAADVYQPQLGIQFETFYIDYIQNDEPTYFNSFVNTGAWTYTASSNDIVAGKKSLEVNYADSKGNAYTSVGVQTGSTATVLSVTPVPAEFGINESLKIKIQFSCKLYPVGGSGNALTVTNAEATVRLEDLIQ